MFARLSHSKTIILSTVYFIAIYMRRVSPSQGIICEQALAGKDLIEISD